MAFQRKSRLVSFRVSESEYECLRQAAAVHGVRGISDVARFAVRKVFSVPHQEQDEFRDLDTHAGESVTKLNQNLQHLTHKMDEIVQRLDLLRDSGNKQL